MYFLILVAIAFLAGAAFAAQTAINSQLSGAMGSNPLAAAFYSFLSAAAILAVISVATGGLLTGGRASSGLADAVAVIPSQPWWRLTGGGLGAIVLVALATLAPRLGVANVLALLIAGQLCFSLVIDGFGLLGVITRQASPVKLAGAAIMLVGVMLTLFGDRLTAGLSAQR